MEYHFTDIISFATIFHTNVKRNCLLDGLNPLSSNQQANTLPLHNQNIAKKTGWIPNVMNAENFLRLINFGKPPKI